MTPTSRSLMVLGTGSDVGKSVIVAGLCRLLRRAGVSVAPFKAQNMSLNSYVTADGGEIGRAQALQAEACGVDPRVDMNPILLKPESDRLAQVIVQGKVWSKRDGKRYLAETETLFRIVRESYERLARVFDVILIEGAGSAAEVNLWDRDIANWRVAELAGAPVLLVADIDRGGVFAQLLGTVELLPDRWRRRIMGLIVNKFRGDRALFDDGRRFLEAKTGIPVLGVVPFLRDLRLDEEDSLHAAGTPSQEFCDEKINIAVILLPRLSNFSDFTALQAEQDVLLRYVRRPHDLQAADVVIIPGTKHTVSDLRYLRAAGFYESLDEHLERGGELVGICGGYQMLGMQIDDPEGIESQGMERGLGYLDVQTVFASSKRTERVRARPLHLFDEETHLVDGYYIHMGRTTGASSPCFRLIGSGAADALNSDDMPAYDGAVRPDGRVWGTSIHGLFDQPGFRRAWLNRVRQRKGFNPLPRSRSDEATQVLESEVDRWADHVSAHLDMQLIYERLRVSVTPNAVARGGSSCG